jgi:hypothetical protein
VAASPAARCATPKAPRAASYTTRWGTTPCLGFTGLVWCEPFSMTFGNTGSIEKFHRYFIGSKPGAIKAAAGSHVALASGVEVAT